MSEMQNINAMMSTTIDSNESNAMIRLRVISTTLNKFRGTKWYVRVPFIVLCILDVSGDKMGDLRR